MRIANAGGMSFLGHPNLTVNERINIHGLFRIQGFGINLFGRIPTLREVLEWLSVAYGDKHHKLWSNKFKGKSVKNWSEPRTYGKNWHGKCDRRKSK